MAQIFHRSANTLARVTIFGAVFAVAFVLWVIGGVVRSPYATDQGIEREQPVPFSHQHHAGGLGIDCRYCHTSVETSNFAGIPPTQTCMNCHSQIWTNADDARTGARQLRHRQTDRLVARAPAARFRSFQSLASTSAKESDARAATAAST